MKFPYSRNKIIGRMTNFVVANIVVTLITTDMEVGFRKILMTGSTTLEYYFF